MLPLDRSMTRAFRVVHLPARTPYVRKIAAGEFTILNGTVTGRGTVPAAVTASWVLDRRPLDWLDILHLHHVDFDDVGTLRRLLAACNEADVKVVYTAHDISAMFCSPHDFVDRMNLIRDCGASWIGLTTASVESLRAALPDLPPVTVIPHGYVVAPETLAGSMRQSGRSSASRYLLYGALRSNRDHLSAIANWSLSIVDPDAQLDVLLRGFSPADFNHHDVPALLAIINSDPRIRAVMRAYPSDTEVAAAGMEADALILPYLYGTHSGQLELAFDLNLLPVCSLAGYFKDQYLMHKDLVEEPVWFDWNEGHPFLYGEKFVDALEAAHERLRNTTLRGLNIDFLEYRREEHRQFLDAHLAVYAS